jgi:hypothetical protein
MGADLNMNGMQNNQEQRNMSSTGQSNNKNQKSDVFSKNQHQYMEKPFIL